MEKAGVSVEQQFQKMKEYLNMDTEIPFDEFEAYYKEIMDALQNDYQSMEHGTLIKVRYITTILADNATARSQRKGPKLKKYRKMAEKSDFWSEAIKFRLLQEGLTVEQIDEAEEKLKEVVEAV